MNSLYLDFIPWFFRFNELINVLIINTVRVLISIYFILLYLENNKININKGSMYNVDSLHKQERERTNNSFIKS